MKTILLIMLLNLGFCVAKSQDTIRYTVNGSMDTRLVRMKDSITIRILSKEKDLQYRLVNVKLSFKKYDMKLLKGIGDTIINLPAKFSKNPVAVFKPGNLRMFKEADAITITAGDIIKKDKKGKTQTAVNVLGREKEWQVVK